MTTKPTKIAAPSGKDCHRNSIFDLDPVVIPCGRDRRCLRRDKHAGPCGRVIALAKDIVRRQGVHIANEAARLILRAIGHEEARDGK